jgi:hypothetical protein
MKALYSIISPVLPVSIGIIVLSGLAAGSVGPLGPNGPYAGLYFIGYPVGLIGILVGLWRSARRAINYFAEPPKDKKTEEDARL